MKFSGKHRQEKFFLLIIGLGINTASVHAMKPKKPDLKVIIPEAPIQPSPDFPTTPPSAPMTTYPPEASAIHLKETPSPFTKSSEHPHRTGRFQPHRQMRAQKTKRSTTNNTIQQLTKALSTEIRAMEAYLALEQAKTALKKAQEKSEAVAKENGRKITILSPGKVTSELDLDSMSVDARVIALNIEELLTNPDNAHTIEPNLLHTLITSLLKHPDTDVKYFGQIIEANYTYDTAKKALETAAAQWEKTIATRDTNHFEAISAAPSRRQIPTSGDDEVMASLMNAVHFLQDNPWDPTSTTEAETAARLATVQKYTATLPPPSPSNVSETNRRFHQ